MAIQHPASLARARRDRRYVRIVDDVVRNIHYAVRVLRRSPGFAVAAILIMALGIGASSTMFSLVHAVLLRDLPYRDADRLVRMVEQGNNGPIWVAWPDFVDWRTMARSFESMGAIRQDVFTVNGLKDPIRVEGQQATAEIFTLAGAGMTAGRALGGHSDAPMRDREDAPFVVVVTRAFARRHWPEGQAIGRAVRQGGDAPWRTVVGVVQDLKQNSLDKDVGAEVFLPLAQRAPRRLDCSAEPTRGLRGVLREPVRGSHDDPDTDLAAQNLLQDTPSRAIRCRRCAAHDASRQTVAPALRDEP